MISHTLIPILNSIVTSEEIKEFFDFIEGLAINLTCPVIEFIISEQNMNSKSSIYYYCESLSK